MSRRISAILIFVVAAFGAASAQPTAFTYQGRITNSSAPANGPVTMEFKIFDAVIGGAQQPQPSPITLTKTVNVANGIFTVELDFGESAFNGSDRYLEITVNGTTLSPRQKVHSTPYAIRARSADSAPPAPNSGNYIQNQNSSDQSASFRISGNGTIGGSLTLGTGTANQPALTFTGDTNTGIFRGAADNLNFSTGGVSRMQIDSGGRVSIGAPGLALRFSVVEPESRVTAIQGRNSYVGDVEGIGVDGFSVNSPGVGMGGGFIGGRVGVQGVARAGTSAFGGYGIIARAEGSAGTRYGVWAGANVSAGTETAYGIYAEASGAATNWAGYFAGNTYIGGNLGIGATPPAAKLHILGASSFPATPPIVVIESSGDQMPLAFKIGATEHARIRADNAGNLVLATLNGGAKDIYFRAGDDSGTDMFIQASTGNIGIGTPAPNDKLEVNGIIRFTGLAPAGGLQLCHNPSNQIARCSSSLRYKTNIAPFSAGLSLIKQLRPITFDWKQGGMHDVGFGAEDVAKIDPLFVTYNDKGEIEGVKYDRLSVAFVNAFKDQQKIIDRQQEQIDALKKLVCEWKPDAAICKEEQK